MRDLCVVCVADQAYQRFAPLFALGVFRAYPDYAVRVYVRGRLKRSIRAAVEIAAAHGELTVLEKQFGDYPRRRATFKSVRWVLRDRAFCAYRYVYIGDIDMLICREEPGLMDYHVRHCAELGLPYSNAIRPHSQRLSGLHFVISDDYFTRTRDVAQQYDTMLREGTLRPERNETVLYAMMKESVGLPPPTRGEGDFDRQRPQHGIHLGLWRSGNILQRSRALRAPSERLTQAQHESFFEEFLRLESTAAAQQILKLCSIPEVSRMKQAYRAYLALRP